MKNKSKFPLLECSLVLAGEVIVSLLVCLVYLAIGQFTYKVATGAVLGTTVMFLNFLFLAISTNRVFDKAEEERGSKEMTEEEIEAFVAEHKRRYENMARISFLARNFTMVAALIVAFLIEEFDVIATLIPLLAFRPILTIQAMLIEKIRKDKS